MFVDLLHSDIARFPDLFWFSCPLDLAELEHASALWNPPEELLSFWKEFGGGDMFESELMLRPLAATSSIEFITSRERRKGLPEGLTVFHMGIFLSAFDGKQIVAFELDSYRTLGRFTDMSSWYRGMLRNSFETRYDLGALVVPTNLGLTAMTGSNRGSIPLCAATQRNNRDTSPQNGSCAVTRSHRAGTS